MIKLTPLDPNNPDHVGWLYKVRTDPRVASHFFAPPPATFIEHVQFLAKTAISQERQFFIVAINKQMCGYCQIIKHPDSVEVGFAIHPDWQGKGIGAASVELLLNHIQLSKNPSPITLTVKKDNERAIKLYKKYGFIEIDENNEKVKMKYIHAHPK